MPSRMHVGCVAALVAFQPALAVPEMHTTNVAADRCPDEFDPRVPLDELFGADTSRRALQDNCDSLLGASEIAAFDALIAANTVMVFARDRTACQVAGKSALQARGACFEEHILSTAEWTYMKCKHPNELVGTTPMHSYFYFGGVFQGNGFKLVPGRMPDGSSMTDAQVDAGLTTAGASLTCRTDGLPATHPNLAQCQSHLTGSMLTLDQINAKLAANDVVLMGWSYCPCTGIAAARFEDGGICFDRTTWDDSSENLMGFLTCLYGAQHHSFIFIGDRFIDNGFRFARTGNPSMGDAELDGLITGASADVSCGPQGDPFFEDFVSNASNPPVACCLQVFSDSLCLWITDAPAHAQPRTKELRRLRHGYRWRRR